MMTLERVLGYSGLLLIIIHLLPFGKVWVVIISVIFGIEMILMAMYLRWKHKINRYIQSHQGTMSIPHLFKRLEEDGHRKRTHAKKTDKQS